MVLNSINLGHLKERNIELEEKMRLNRPIMYLSLPGLALVIGLCWLHRKRSTEKNRKNKENEDENTSNKSVRNVDTNELEGGNFGKSVAIDIVQSRKSSYHNQPESEILKFIVLPNELKCSNSIEEDSGCTSLSVRLPDSSDGILNVFSGSRVKTENSEKPLIIKATSTAKISPENLFSESKYTEKDQNILENFTIFEQEDILSKSVEKSTEAQSPISDYSVHSNDSRNDFSLTHSSTTPKMYEFFIPVNLISKLCGRKNNHLENMKIKSKAKILLKKHPNSNKVKICVIEGTENEINVALSLIRSRLPTDNYPYLTMDRIYLNIPQTKHSLNFVGRQISLVEGINNDVSVSAAVSAGHIFLQHPLHPSNPSLNILQTQLNEYYSNKDTPNLPEIIDNAICVGKVDADWYRLQIINIKEHKGTCLVKLLDFGGYVSIFPNNLRQIRADFLLTPFQATECLLSNIAPMDGGWSIEATEVLMQLTKGIILQAQVIGYTRESLPKIYLFAKLASNCVLFINKELVARKFAIWTEDSD